MMIDVDVAEKKRDITFIDIHSDALINELS